ncbi:MAG: lysozyme inhibitor LprI family protein [Tateyamaria sp.]
MLRSLPLALVLALPAAAAQANDCADAQTTAEMLQCAGARYDAADAGLNDAYKLARDAAREADDLNNEDADSGAVHHLREAQRAWIQLRDADCVLAGFPFRGGTMETVLVTHCLADMTEKRTRDLRDIALDLGY